MFVTKQRILYRLPFVFPEERKTEMLTVRHAKDAIWIETTLPPKKANQEMFLEEDE
jgi:hypothetical protein